MSIFPPQVMQAARICIKDIARPEPGQKILFLNELSPRVDEDAIRALAAVAQLEGAEVTSMWVPQLDQSWWQAVPDQVIAAIEASNIVVYSHYTIGRAHKQIHKAIFEKGVIRIRNYGANIRTLMSDWARFPMELYDEIDMRLLKLMRTSKTFRIIDDLGTDVTGELGLALNDVSKVKVRRESKNRHFPPGTLPPTKAKNTQGVLFTQHTYPWGAKLWGLPETLFENPVKLTVENNRVTKVEGGREADLYRKAMDYIAVKSKVGDEIFKIDSWHGGSHHKAHAPVSSSIDPVLWHQFNHHHPSFLHFHIGGDPDRDYGTPFMTHIMASVLNGTLYLDGEKVIDHGRLMVLEDPEIIAKANELGSAEDLLSTRPLQF